MCRLLGSFKTICGNGMAEAWSEEVGCLGLSKDNTGGCRMMGRHLMKESELHTLTM